MKLGVVFPQTEIGSDPSVIRDYAQAAEQLGYRDLHAFDHVLGGHPDRFRGRLPGFYTQPPYTHESPFHEPFVLFGYLAAVTTRIELVTGILILPQRQTALVAKQAAEVDLLSQERLRLGVGIGWSFVEYEALGETFRNRGARIEEQIEVLRRLWSEALVDFEGKYHTLRQVALLPRPRRRIPIWMGGMADPVLRRVARLADGWLPQLQPGPQATEMIGRLRGYVQEAGRPANAVPIGARLTLARTPEDQWGSTVEQWRELGVDYLALNTMAAGLPSPQAHIDAIRRFMETVGN